MSDQNNQGSINPANIAGRKIAQPRRRLQRTVSEDTAQPNPLSGFTFGNNPAPPPQQQQPIQQTAFGAAPAGTAPPSPFGAQQPAQPTTPTLGRSFSATSSFQFNMSQQQQQQQQISPSQQANTSSNLTPGAPGFGVGGSFTFGSGSSSTSTPQQGSGVAFGFGGSAAPVPTSTTTNPSGAQSTFSFGQQQPQQQPSFGFGTTASTSTPTPPSTSTAQPAFGGFGAQQQTPSTAFGTTTSSTTQSIAMDETMDKDETPKPIASGFTFGGGSSLTATPASSIITTPSPAKPLGFGFGTVANKDTTTTSTTSTAATTPTTPSFSFGASASTASSKPSFGFGSASTTTPTTTSSDTTAATGAATAPTFSFAKPMSIPEKTSTLTTTSPFAFGNTSQQTPTTTDTNKPSTAFTGFGTTKAPTAIPGASETSASNKEGEKSSDSSAASAPKPSPFTFPTSDSTSTSTSAKPLAFSFGNAPTKAQDTEPKKSVEAVKEDTQKGGQPAVERKESEKQQVPVPSGGDNGGGTTSEKTLEKKDSSATLTEVISDNNNKDDDDTEDADTDKENDLDHTSKTATQPGENWFAGSRSLSSSSGESAPSAAATASLPTFSITSSPSPTTQERPSTESLSKGPSPFIFPKPSDQKQEGPKATSTTTSTAPSIGFGQITQSTDKKEAPPKPSFSFGTPTVAATSDPSSMPSFSFGKPQDKKSSDVASSSEAAPTTTPSFSFGTSTAPASASQTKPIESLDQGPSPFNFSMPKTTETTSSEKSTAPATPSFGGFNFKGPDTTKSTTSATTPTLDSGTAFTFGGGPASSQGDSSTTTPSMTFGGGSSTAAPKESTTQESNKKRKSSDQLAAAETSRQKFVHGKSPLSQSWSVEESQGDAYKKFSSSSTSTTPGTMVSGLSGAIPPRKRSVDNAGMTPPASPAPGKKAALSEIQNKENHGAEKHVSFKDTKANEKGKSASTTTTDKSESLSPFKPLQSKPIEIPTSQPSSSTSKSQSTPNDVFGPPAPTKDEQTIIESKITNPDSIEKRTRYRDLPPTAQNELNALYQFIGQQMDISKTIETRQSAYNGELISQIENYADNCTKELRLQKDLHQVSTQKIGSLTTEVEYQFKNAMVGRLFFDNQGTQGRSMTGTTVHQRYFNDLTTSLETRMKEYRAAINQIDERVQTMVGGSSNATATPEQIPAILKSQSNTLVSLAAKVSELHQDVEKLKKNNKHIMNPHK